MLLPISLKAESRVLVAGVGGGFDFLCGLPIGLCLEKLGHRVWYANYSFTNLAAVSGRRLSSTVVEVSGESTMDRETYFPEGYFSQWFKEEKNRDVRVYCFEKTGIGPLREAYDLLYRLHDIDACILVDGGVDGIFRGDEFGLGTPSMDSISMIAANLSSIPERHYCFTAFGTEGVGNEVAHADALERVSDLIAARRYHGVAALVDGYDDAVDFIACCRHIFSKMPMAQHSNIVCSILKALEGRFGYTAVNAKTEINPIWLSALTTLYWFFDLDKTVKMKLYYRDVLNTATIMDVSNAIDKYRGAPGKKYRGIPI